MGRQDKCKKSVERLKQIKRVLESVPPELFDIGDWTTRKQLDNKGTCGTAHCVGGWLRLDTWWQENTDVARVFSVDEHFPDVVWPAWHAVESHSGGLAGLLARLVRIRKGEAEVLFGLDGRDGYGWEGYPDHTEGLEAKEGMLRYVDELIRRRAPYALGIIPDNPDWNPAAYVDAYTRRERLRLTPEAIKQLKEIR